MSTGQAGLSELSSMSSEAGRDPWQLICHLEHKRCAHNTPSPNRRLLAFLWGNQQKCMGWGRLRAVMWGPHILKGKATSGDPLS